MFVTTILAKIRTYLRYRETVRELSLLSDRELDDLGISRFQIDSIEIDRGGLSFTVETLAALAARWESAELFWLIGADVLKSFAKWREPRRITELATVVVLERTGETPDLTSIPGTPRLLASRRIDISSTEIRQRVREGKSIRGFVPDAVAEYIAAERLYR